LEEYNNLLPQSQVEIQLLLAGMGWDDAHQIRFNGLPVHPFFNRLQLLRKQVVKVTEFRWLFSTDGW
jgi:hypothetical protein